MDSPSPLLYLLIVVFLLCSAFFSSSETAVSTVNKLRLKKRAEEGDKRARSALNISENYDKTLFAILIGNNIVNIGASAIATIIATYWFGGKGAVISTAVMTVLVLTFGEIIPKSYGNDSSEKVALWVARPLRLLTVLFTPFIWLFMHLKDLMLPAGDKAPTVTEEELLYMLESIEEEGVIEEQERDLVQSALEFDEIAIREILTPRVDIVAVDVEADADAIRETILGEGYSRIPVFEGSIDNIVGVLFAKDYLRCLIRGEEIRLREMLSEPLFVHRTMKIAHLLASLKANKVNLAVVTDDYGGTLGIVTMEDVLEELVGEIWDEDDEVVAGLVPLEEGGCEVPGSYNLRELFEELDLEPEEEDGDYSTVNGWAMHLFEHIPKVGETLEQGPLTLTILEMDGHRIKRLALRVTPEPEEEPDEENLLEKLRRNRGGNDGGEAPGEEQDDIQSPGENASGTR